MGTEGGDWSSEGENVRGMGDLSRVGDRVEIGEEIHNEWAIELSVSRDVDKETEIVR